MSGHSKWSKVKHQKAVTDAVKGQAFTKASRAITLAVREGGGVADPEKNFRLRLAVELARAVNMPKETIERAIERGAKEGENPLESLVYEAYGPGGVALLIAAATDNRQRTIGQVKNVVEKSGGTIASPGSVHFLFDTRGVVSVQKSTKTLDEITEAAIMAGADDVEDAGDTFELYAAPARVHEVREHLLQAGIAVESAEIIMKPKMPTSASDEVQRATETLVEQLEALDDVQIVYTNLL